MNKQLINVLEELRDISDIEGEIYREKAYRKAISSIRKLDYEITRHCLPNPKTNKIPGIGTGIYAKVAEFITTGRIAELEKLRQSPRVRAFRVFSKILGVGPATIDEWIKLRIYDLPSLRRAISTGRVVLNHMQKLGVKYYTDLNERIPRDEVTALGARIYAILDRLKPGIRFEISGSYRRGAITSGDIDIIITHDDWSRDLLAQFRREMSHDDDYIDTTGQGEQRLTFLYRSPMSGKVRQIDILWVAADHFVPAVLYFTGNWEFNERMRGAAKKKGYRLNQMGLYRIGPGRDLVLVSVRDEREIFDILDIPYVPPAERG